MLSGAANKDEELFATRAHGGRVRQVAFPLDEGARALDGVAGQERTLAADPPIILCQVRLGGYGNRIQFVNGARAVVLRERDLGGDERARSR